MAASAAKTSKGAKLEVGNGATPEVFTAVAEVKSISGPGQSSGALDATHLGSDADEKIPGRISAEDVSCEANFLAGNATQAAILTDLQAGTTHNFRVVNADGKGYEFKGFASNFSVKFDLGSVQGLTFKVTISGLLTVVA